MQDRIPRYPGRVKLTPVDGQENVFDMVRADEPEQEGTALNKASLLTDEAAQNVWPDAEYKPEDPTVSEALGYIGKKAIMTDAVAAKYGLSGDNATADRLFDALASSIIGQGITTLTVLDGDGNPFPNVSIKGVTSQSGDAVTTDSNGTAQVVVTAEVDVTFSSGFADVPDYVQTLTPNFSEVNNITVTIPYAEAGTFSLYNSSQTLKFHKAHTVNLSIVGGGQGGQGGGGGGAEYDTTQGWDGWGGYAGAGGASGKVYNVTNAEVSGEMVLAVGAGGAGSAGVRTDGGRGSTGTAGGNTTFGSLSSASGSSSKTPIGSFAVGGSGGAGGNGGYYAYGGSYSYGKEGYAGTRGGGNGGGGFYLLGEEAPSGGNYLYNTTKGENGSAGINGGGGGGGGGGGYYLSSSTNTGRTYGGDGGKGGSGCLVIGWL